MIPLRQLALAAALLLAACDNGGGTSVQGYAEGEFRALAPSVAGRLLSRPVARGDHVAAGTLLFTVDQTAPRAARDQAKAQLAQTKANLADLETGARPEDIAVIDAEIAEARAAVENTRRDLIRIASLASAANASRAALDNAQAASDQARARLDALTAQRAVAELPARTDRLDAARAAVAAAEAALTAAEFQLSETEVRAPADGTVAETLRDPGEMIAAGSPVLTLLPDDGTKIRFFLPEPLLPRAAIGATVHLACDGCGSDLAARVTYVAPKEEFTPPTVYTVQNRKTFVYLVEARQTAGAPLRPGQPLDVSLVTP